MNKIKGDREAASGRQGRSGQVLFLGSFTKKVITVASGDLSSDSQAGSRAVVDFVSMSIGDALGLNRG